MKPRIYLLAVMLLYLTVSSNAQSIEKGAMLIGGSINFGTSNQSTINTTQPDSIRSTGGNIGISLGKAVTNNGILGVSLSYGRNKIKSSIDEYDDENSYAYAASIFYRQFVELGNKFYFWVQPSAGIVYAEGKKKDNSNYSKNMSMGLALAPGLSYNFYKSIYLDVSINNLAALSYNSSQTATVKQNSFSVTSGLSGGSLNNVGIGFSIIF